MDNMTFKWHPRTVEVIIFGAFMFGVYGFKECWSEYAPPMTWLVVLGGTLLMGAAFGFLVSLVSSLVVTFRKPGP